MKESFILLRQYKNKLTRQQLLTFKGQIKKGDYNGFKKGLLKVINNDKKENNKIYITI